MRLNLECVKLKWKRDLSSPHELCQYYSRIKFSVYNSNRNSAHSQQNLTLWRLNILLVIIAQKEEAASIFIWIAGHSSFTKIIKNLFKNRSSHHFPQIPFWWSWKSVLGSYALVFTVIIVSFYHDLFLTISCNTKLLSITKQSRLSKFPTALFQYVSVKRNWLDPTELKFSFRLKAGGFWTIRMKANANKNLSRLKLYEICLKTCYFHHHKKRIHLRIVFMPLCEIKVNYINVFTG